MLVTTSRYSSQATRNFAKNFAKIISCKYVARGKKAIDSLVLLARKNGDDKICVAIEKSSLLDHLEFLTIKPNLKWSWEIDQVPVKHESEN
ncbi:MAG: hypothetical protein Q7S22_04510 [Candidatus Micrarchaeota archaeon]|nr:hypothetical protein [Candidatus Micrarchaeota archaeon]